MDDTFRRVQALLPSADVDWEKVLQSKASRLYVAVLKHHSENIPSDPEVEDFIWLKAHGKLTLSRIIAAYKAQLRLDDDTPLVFKLGGNILSEDTTVSQLPIRDRFLIMSASTEQPPATQQSADSGTLSPRPPLQPVSRQLTFPPMQSQDEGSKAATPAVSASPAVATPPPAVANDPIGAVKVEGERDADPTSSLPQQSASMAIGHDFPAGDLTATPTAGHLQEAQGRSADVVTHAQVHPAAATPKVEEQEPETQYEPRDQGNPFTASQNADDVEYTRGKQLQQLAAEETPERLEAGVAAGLKVLTGVEQALQKLGDHEDAANWLKQIEKVRKDGSKTRTVVGVVGNTGAGKSSVINAMLEEERLVPTNCMRACTAVVTELSYNDSTNPHMKYRACIEFIKPEDWQRELHVLFKEIFDESGNISREIANPDSEAGIAYAKVRAVYHQHTREMLANTSVDSLMRQKHVKNVLGEIRNIKEKDPEAFYKHLKQYVDSKEKGTERLDKNGNKIANAKRDFEYWPLIKVVKIYVKADALSTGAVIVDLPGVHDSNAARAAVAEGYMKECTGLWIVAPINRAVDDKAAKTLLGDTFKRQLKYDGTYSCVTFLCSKTDDISRMEASDSLNLGDEYNKLEDKMIENERARKSVRTELKEKRGKKKDYEETIDQVEEEIEKWEGLADKLEQGKTVYPPTQKKRKRRESSGGSSKRRRRAGGSDDESNDRSSAEPEDETSNTSAVPLTEEAVNTKLEELKQMKKDARREKNVLADRISDLEESMDDLAAEMDDIDARQNALCIAGRNEYSRGAIQQDFAAGLRELDMEQAFDEDPDNFNPEEDIRDYEKAASDLPVFCVSSRAYQKLSGRLLKDNAVPGFTTKEQTGIPDLQRHCRDLTVKGRQASCRRFLNSLQSLLNSMSLWASDDGTGIKMTNAQRDAEKAFLGRKLKELEKALEKTVSDTLEDAVDSLNEQLFEKFTGAIKSAVDDALPTSSRWGAKKDQGGLYYSTYKATVRRQGVFTSPTAGHRDFNGELAEPLYKYLASAWEKTFQRRLPNILQSCTRSATDVVKKFHAAVEQRVCEKGHGISRIGMIGQQVQTHNAKFADLVASAIETLNNGQRDINREFTPVIANAMEPSYQHCTDDRGPGVFLRMKSHMESHVSTERSNMFRTASEVVRKSLLKLFNEVKGAMLDKADEVYVSMQRDYLTLVGVQRSEIRMSREERAIRREVDDEIGNADFHFSKVLDASLDNLKAEQPVGGDEVGLEAGDDAFDNDMVIDDGSGDEEVDEDGADENSQGDEENGANSDEEEDNAVSDAHKSDDDD